ncbi:MAG: primosomal protein N' [Halofilum sp. (in: g-proteobacteria)]
MAVLRAGRSVSAPILRVAVPGPLTRLFDYLPPVESADSPAPPVPGTRVLVPFGRSRRVAVVVQWGERSDVAPQRLRPIERALEASPALPHDLMALAEWAAGYYHHPLGEVLSAMLPAALRRPDPPDTEEPPRWRLTAAGRDTCAAGIAGAPVQQRLLTFIGAHPEGVDQSALKTLSDRYHAPLRTLQAKALVEPAPREPIAATTRSGPALHDAQSRAVTAIADTLGVFAPFLLHGVTGSGKTEVYLSLIATVLAQGRQALVLVPEIGLTPQLLARFGERLATPVALLHSGLTDRERLAAWRRAASGEAGVVLGTRSAVFAPLPALGLIIVDEEHDPSLKQQEGFRYHARDLAVIRAQRAAVPVVLGSATPSLETLSNARRGAYATVELDERAGGAKPPRLELVDVRRRRAREGLSIPLIESMQAELDSGGQVLLFLNRRGWAPTLICDDCGWTAECSRCDARMTVHRRKGRLRCHHCGADAPEPTACADCASEALVHLGQGTERVEEALAEQFPAVETIRIDRDSTRRRGALDAKLKRVRSGEAGILLGTQMLAKGHDFPGVTLVGVLDADRGLFGADFRSAEHLAQTVLQVAGRAGRGERPGRVLIQTRNPEHPLLQALIAQGYGQVAASLLEERAEAGFPPAAHMALIRAEAPHAEAPEQCLAAAREQLEAAGVVGVEVFGPAPAPLERIAGRYRAQLALQAPTRAPLHAALRQLRPWLEEAKPARRVRWSIDVDPVDLT